MFSSSSQIDEDEINMKYEQQKIVSYTYQYRTIDRLNRNPCPEANFIPVENFINYLNNARRYERCHISKPYIRPPHPPFPPTIPLPYPYHTPIYRCIVFIVLLPNSVVSSPASSVEGICFYEK